MRRLLIAVAVGGLLVAACGANDTGSPATTDTTVTSTSSPPGISHPTGADEVVLRMYQTGGFVSLEYNLGRFPEWTLYGDGTLVYGGPQIEIFPPPALPNLLQRSISPEGVQVAVQEAIGAGLTGENRRYGNDCVADATDTVFTLTADGETTVVEVYALGLDELDANCGIDEENAAARRALSGLLQEAFDVESWLPQGSVGAEEPFEAEAMRVFVTPQVADNPELPQEPVDWPLDVLLASFGEPVVGYNCGTVDGADLETLITAATGTNTLTPWLDDGEDYQLVLRPMLPDEEGCRPEDVSGS